MSGRGNLLDPIVGQKLTRNGVVLPRTRTELGAGFSVTDDAANDRQILDAAGSSAADPVEDVAALRQLDPSSGDVVDGQARSVLGDPVPWIYSATTGAGFVDDGVTVVKPSEILTASPGRWYRATSAPVLPTIAALRLAASGAHEAVQIKAYDTLGDGGGGAFVWDADHNNATEPDDGGIVIVPTALVGGTGAWRRLVVGTAVDARWFGLVVNDSGEAAANVTAIHAARDYVNAKGGGIVDLPPGQVLVSSKVSIPSGYRNVTIRGAGHDYTVSPRADLGTFLRPSASFPLGETVLQIMGRRCGLRDLGVDGWDEDDNPCAGQGIDFTSDGTGIFIHGVSERVAVRGIEVQERTFTASGNTLTVSNNPFQNGDQVYASSDDTLPAGLTEGTIDSGDRFYVINRTDTTLELSALYGDVAVTLSDTGIGTHTLRGRGYAVHIGGYTTGRQVSNSRWDSFQITESDIWVFVDGSSGTTDIKLSNWAVNNQKAGVLDTGSVKCEHVNVQSGGAVADYIIRPTFAGAVFRDCKHEITNGGPAFLFTDGQRPWPSILDQVDIQFANGATGNDVMIDFRQDGPLYFKGGCQFRLGTPVADTGKVSVVGTTGGGTARVFDEGTTYLNDATFDLANLGAVGPAIYNHVNVYGPHVDAQLVGQKNGGFHMTRMVPEPSATPDYGVIQYVGAGARSGEGIALITRGKHSTLYDSKWEERSILKRVERYNLTAEVHESAADGQTTQNEDLNLYSYELPSNSAHQLLVLTIGRRTGGSAGGSTGDLNCYLDRLVVKNIGGTVAISHVEAVETEVADDSAWEGPSYVESGDDVQIHVAGKINATIHWTVSVYGPLG